MKSQSQHHSLPAVQVGKLQFQLEGELASFRAGITCEEMEPRVHHLHLRLVSDSTAIPNSLKLKWQYPITDIQALWHPGCNAKRWLTLPWDITVKSQVTEDAPVICLYNCAGQNRLTFACSDVLNHVELTASIDEITASFGCHLHLFAHPTAPLREYQITLRIDQRPQPYHRSLDEVQSWWTSQPGVSPSFVPEAARLPMYSTWYSFHQEMTDASVETQCRLAREIGCEAVIIDDGWQTEDNSRGYTYCGDWEVCAKKFPDFAAHIARLHQIGMKSLLWFSVPFVGFKSRAYPRFQGKYLIELERMQAAVLDPRYPEVREYLIALYEKAIREWDLDGLKLDFVDQFTPTKANYEDDSTGRDIDSVPLAVDRLLRDTLARLSRIKPDIMIEFRQPYIGPLMRNYGNLFRAADCPNDAICNRVRTIDVRLLTGSTAAHSDMLMWSREESVETAALQFLNILFSVPQISVKLDQIPADHHRMLRFWLGFWRDHRDVLLDGALEPHHPELQYPFIVARKEHQWIAALYSDLVASFPDRLPLELYLINATPKNRVVVETGADSGIYHVEERNVLGELVEKRKQSLPRGIHSMQVGPSGMLRLQRA